MNLRFYDPLAETQAGFNRVPHWDQREAVCFVTFRLADSLPAEPLRALMEEKERWLAEHPEKPWPADVEKEYHRKFNGRVERWLDQGAGSCLLRDPVNAGLVGEALRHFEGERCRMHAWVVMPNHVHALFSPVGGHALPELIHSWKGFSARQINQRMTRSGPVWQKGYFDRLVRDWEHFGRCVRYIRANPGKAGLEKGAYLLEESDMARRV